MRRRWACGGGHAKRWSRCRVAPRFLLQHIPVFLSRNAPSHRSCANPQHLPLAEQLPLCHPSQKLFQSSDASRGLRLPTNCLKAWCSAPLLAWSSELLHSLCSPSFSCSVCFLLFLPTKGVWTVIRSKVFVFAYSSFLIHCISIPRCSAGFSFGEKSEGFGVFLFKLQLDSCSCLFIFTEDLNTSPSLSITE